MDNTNYHHTLIVLKKPTEVFNAITRVSDWWTVNTDGKTRMVDDEFTVQFKDVHLTRQRIIEVVPGERITWRVTECHLPWVQDLEEWKGTEMIFDIASLPEGSRLSFTHIGLTPGVECFDQCKKGWDYFIGTSLYKLIMEGTGLPDTSQRKHFDTIGHVSTGNT